MDKIRFNVAPSNPSNPSKFQVGSPSVSTSVLNGLNGLDGGISSKYNSIKSNIVLNLFFCMLTPQKDAPVCYNLRTNNIIKSNGGKCDNY